MSDIGRYGGKMKFLTFKQDGYETLGIASQDGKTVYALPGRNFIPNKE